MKLIQQASHLKWNPVCVVHVLFSAHVTARVENWRPVGRLDITVAAPFSKVAAIQVAPRLAFPFPCADWALFQALHWTVKQALHWTVEATCMLDRSLTSPGLTISQNKSVFVASHSQLRRAIRRELLEQGISFEGEDSVRDVGLDAENVTKGMHIKVLQNGLKLKHQTMNLFKTGILAAVACGHAGMHVPEVYAAQEDDGCRFVWQEEQDRLHHPTLPLRREWGPSYLVSAGSASNLARAPKRRFGAQIEQD